ncbi:MBL fold metallo-hydrolase (plasmid) [Haloferacaceae archaeon DSL9]
MTYIAEPRLERLYDGFRTLRHSDPGAVRMGMATNCYAVLSETRDEAVYFDVNIEDLFPLVNELADEGHAPAALVLTHNHVAINGEKGVEKFRDRYEVPVFLHPTDGSHPHLQDVKYENPIGSDLLRAFDLEVEGFPGQTEGSIVAYWYRHGTVMIAGDSAMGATIDQEAGGIERLIRPPVETSWNDRELRRQWEAFDRRISGIAPYHGAIYVDIGGRLDQFLTVLRRQEPTPGRV